MEKYTTASGHVEYVDLTTPINLPVNAPRGHPHIIEDLAAASNFFGSDFRLEVKIDPLLAVDVVASVVHAWKPVALKDLLDLSKETFDWGAIEDGYETYIRRTGNIVKVSTDCRSCISWIQDGNGAMLTATIVRCPGTRDNKTRPSRL